MKAKWLSEEPKVLEKRGVSKWEWRRDNEIPTNLSPGAELTIKAYREKQLMYDIVQ